MDSSESSSDTFNHFQRYGRNYSRYNFSINASCVRGLSYKLLASINEAHKLMQNLIIGFFRPKNLDSNQSCRKKLYVENASTLFDESPMETSLVSML